MLKAETYIILFIAYFLPCKFVFSQHVKELPSLEIKKSKDLIIIDGELNETDWKIANIASDFFQSFPADTSYTKSITEVKVTYDDLFIYIGAVCYDELKGDYVIQSLKRDFSYPISDAFAVFIDPFNDKTNGFSFAVNPMGVQREGLLEGGADFGVTTSWDNKWFSKVTRHSDRWVVEMAIPFKSIRYKPSLKVWGINFSRNDLKRNENGSWAPVPRNFNIASLAFTGNLNWDVPPKKAGSNVSIIPYGIGNTKKDYQTNTAQESGYNAGADAKLAISSSLNLDLTINPDFSQVEVDQQQTNLTRFSLYYPERRQFFIENSDLFGQFGFRQIRPFFSRKIGLQDGETIPIIAGARLSGKINRDWRVGFLNMQTSSQTRISDIDTTLISAQNYTVAVLQRQVLKRSNITGILVNRQRCDSTKFDSKDYNRIAGIQFELASADNQWRGKVFYQQSINPGKPLDNISHASWLMHNTANISFMWNHEYVGEGFISDVGFVPRNQIYNPEKGYIEHLNYWRWEPMFSYRFYKKNSVINFHSPGFYISHYNDDKFVTTEYKYQLNYRIAFVNSADFEAKVNKHYTKLFYDRDITFSNGTPIPSGNYEWYNSKISFSSNKRKKLTYEIWSNYGTYFNGTKLSYGGKIKYRLQPWGIFTMSYQQNEIRLPNPYQTTYLSLIGPKIELSLTKSIFFTTFLQYNTQLENFNINSRFQWRFKPMSDLYIVYTENYFSPEMQVKNRAMVVKLIYWLAI